MTTPAAALSLESLAADYWTAVMAQAPTWATGLSVHEHDSRLEDISPEALDAWRAKVKEFLARCDDVAPGSLSPRQRVTLAMLRHELTNQLLGLSLGFETWSVDQLGGPQVGLLDLVRVHLVTDRRSAATWLDRVRAMSRYVDQHVANLERGLAAGRVAPSCTVVRVLEQLDDQLAAPPSACPLLAAHAVKPAEMDDAEWAEWRVAILEAIASGVLPAFARLRDLLKNRIAPVAREKPGLCAFEDGVDIYRKMIRLHVALDPSPQELHDIGLAEVARIRSEMKQIVGSVFGTDDLAGTFKMLREDPKWCFGSREEIVASAKAAVRRATLAATECFDLLPDHECDVRPVDAHAEKSSAAAFYMQPAPDGSRPGTYYVNTCEPTTRPRHECEAVAFHEAVPGHHLQIALAQKIDGVPEFQRHCHSTAYAEGWALYTEKLSDELGLYSGPMDRLGMLSCDALRACRLVVDTGLHAFGWSRERAIEYMAENTTGSMTDIRNEVDRYIAWPGQAVSYKAGQIEILRLRKQAQDALGPKFRLGAFHRVVLENGGIVLPVLREQVEKWIAEGRA